MTALRANALAIHTVKPDDFSFGRLCSCVRLVASAGGAPLAAAAMPEPLWRRLLASTEMVAAAHSIGKMTITFELSRGEDDMSNGMRAASGVRLGFTDRGRFIVEFLDASGAVFAYAELTDANMRQFLEQGDDLLAIVRKGGLATTECVGTA